MSHLGHIVAQHMTVLYINTCPFRLASRYTSKLPQNGMEFCSRPLGVRYSSAGIFRLTGGLCKRAPCVPRCSNNYLPCHSGEQVLVVDIVIFLVSNNESTLMTVLSADNF
jgi:hypothetical protein